ncbi:MAG TPA: carboxymuconolactone decarboxylase family protein [Burkholderiales bacterium]|nr:carboxymuconolactone decarboxylase family protein [Burkholderiales bacterium]
MARVPLIGEERGDLAAFISRVKSERGRLINLYRVLLNSPPVAESWLDFNSTVRFKTALEPALREMIILRVCVLNGAEYQAQIHGASHASKAGVTRAQIEALGDWRPSAVFTDAQRAALAWTDAMTGDIEVPDALHVELRRYFDDRQVVEITVLVGAYNMHTRVARALEIDTERGTAST